MKRSQTETRLSENDTQDNNPAFWEWLRNRQKANQQEVQYAPLYAELELPTGPNKGRSEENSPSVENGGTSKITFEIDITYINGD